MIFDPPFFIAPIQSIAFFTAYSRISFAKFESVLRYNASKSSFLLPAILLPVCVRGHV